MDRYENLAQEILSAAMYASCTCRPQHIHLASTLIREEFLAWSEADAEDEPPATIPISRRVPEGV